MRPPRCEPRPPGRWPLPRRRPSRWRRTRRDRDGSANPALGPTPYQVTNTGITRLPVPILNMPQTVNVIPQAIIQEQNVTTIEQALQYIPGITFSAGEGGQQGDGPIIRGFVARGDLFRDGIRDPGWYTRDAFSIDRIEVYKGPSAFAFGRGATGGAINYVTRLPTGAQYLEFDLDGDDGQRLPRGGRRQRQERQRVRPHPGAVAGRQHPDPRRDLDQALGRGAVHGLRLPAGHQGDAVLHLSGRGGRVGLRLHLSAATGVQSPDRPATNPGYYGNGRPTTPLPIPRTNFLGLAGGPLGDITTTDTHIITEKIEHEFDKDLKLSNATRYIDNERFARVTAPRNVGLANNNFPGRAGSPTTWDGTTFPFNYPVDLLTYGRERRERETDNTYLINQTDLVGKFITGIAEHQMSAGLEAARETRHQDRRDLCDSTNVACRTNAFNPDPNGSPVGGAIINFLPIETKAVDYAAYVSDQVKITKYFELLASLRYDYFSTNYQDPNQALVINRNLERTDNLFSYRFGAVVHPTEKSSIYAAYGNSYNPSAELGTLASASNAALAPEQTRSIEVGAKADVRNGLISLAGAVFRIEKTNLRINDPFNTTVMVLDGIARVDGVEVGATGKVTDRWSVFTGYSYLEIDDPRHPRQEHPRQASAEHAAA